MTRASRRLRRTGLFALMALCLALVAVGLAQRGPLTAAEPPDAGTVTDAPPAAAARRFVQPWTGDLDGMIGRGRIRALVPFSRTFYFLDGGTQRGLTYELLKAFEAEINDELRSDGQSIEVVVIPVGRDRLIPGLLDGLGDIAAGNLTITPERAALVDFSNPLLTGVSEIVVTGPSGPQIATLDDLSGTRVHVRPSSSYYTSLVRLNDRFRAAGRPEIELIAADEHLEDEDLLELVDAGLLPMIVMDDHKASFWAQFFPNIAVHPEIAVNTGGEIAWAFRRNSPQLEAAINAFMADNRKGSLLGNILYDRYLNDTHLVENANPLVELTVEDPTIAAIVRRAAEYEIDWPMVAAVGYQESRLDHDRRSTAGAVGVMQVLPSTARDANVGVTDFDTPEGNIHAGVKYLRFLHDRYFATEEMSELDRWLFTFAAYNAGPSRVAGLRRDAAERGLDPDRWFRNVELVAADQVGRETVQYVRNVYKYYIAYGLIEERLAIKDAALDDLRLEVEQAQ